jgi:hypothetical protein
MNKFQHLQVRKEGEKVIIYPEDEWGMDKKNPPVLLGGF